jgi:hypothetical protein
LENHREDFPGVSRLDVRKAKKQAEFEIERSGMSDEKNDRTEEADVEGHKFDKVDQMDQMDEADVEGHVFDKNDQMDQLDEKKD